MLTKHAQEAIKAEIALLDKKHVEIDFAKAILLQALELAEKLPVAEVKKAVTLPAPKRKSAKQNRAITPENRGVIISLIQGYLITFSDDERADAKGITEFLTNKGYNVTRKGIACFLARQEKAGLIKRHKDSSPTHVFYEPAKGV